MLEKDPSKRIDSTQILNHSWFEQDLKLDKKERFQKLKHDKIMKQLCLTYEFKNEVELNQDKFLQTSSNSIKKIFLSNLGSFANYYSVDVKTVNSGHFTESLI